MLPLPLHTILEDFYFSPPNFFQITILSKKFEFPTYIFTFSAQDSDLEWFFWRSKHPPVSSDLKPPSLTKRATKMKRNLVLHTLKLFLGSKTIA